MDFDETGLKRFEIYSNCALVTVCMSLAASTFSPEREKVGLVDKSVSLGRHSSFAMAPGDFFIIITFVGTEEIYK